MINENNQSEIQEEQEVKVEKVLIKDIEKNKEDELVDKIMEKILKIK